jgi:hypothetical protein
VSLELSGYLLSMQTIRKPLVASCRVTEVRYRDGPWSRSMTLILSVLTEVEALFAGIDTLLWYKEMEQTW